MDRLPVFPSENINKDLTMFSESLFFNIQKVTKSALGCVRFFIEKKGCQLCIEEYIPEGSMPLYPYLEITTYDEDKYQEAVNTIAMSDSAMEIINYDSSIGEHPITIFSDRECESMSIIILLIPEISSETLITITDAEEDSDEKE